MSKKKTAGSSPFEALRALRDELQRKAQDPSRADAEVRTAARAPRAAPPPEKGSKGAPAGSEEEALLFHRLFAGVEPLARTPGRIPRQRIERSAAAERTSEAARDAAVAEAHSVHERMRRLVDENARFEVSDDGRHVEGRRLDVPVDVVRKLRRGTIPVDARVDLHGMRVQEAQTHLELFLRTMRARGERCVLVIHGKGAHSPLCLGVLRGEISTWLSQGRASEHVAAFATARRDDGGEGAVYVLFRR